MHNSSHTPRNLQVLDRYVARGKVHRVDRLASIEAGDWMNTVLL